MLLRVARAVAGQKALPKSVGQDVTGERLHEDAVVDPHEVQFRVFGDNNRSPFDALPMKRGDARAVLFGHPLESVGRRVQIVRAELREEEGPNAGLVDERNVWIPREMVGGVPEPVWPSPSSELNWRSAQNGGGRG